MLELHDAKVVMIPPDIHPDTFLDSIRLGHNYRLLKYPSGYTRCVPPDTSLPELFVMTDRILLDDKNGDASRIEDLLRVLKNRRPLK